ncbi:MAG: ribosome silencing factor [Deltaproteobacteria bacterium]
MAKATKSGKGAKSKSKGPARGAAKGKRPTARKGPAARGAPKGKPASRKKAPTKRFFVGKAPRPAQGRKGAAPVRTERPVREERPGLKRAALRTGKKVTPRPAPAAPVSTAVVVAPMPPDEGQLRALAAVAAGAEKKAESPIVLDVRGISGVADYFVLLSADSDRQAAAVADYVDARLTDMGAQRLGAEGRSGGGWVLLDFGDVVVHVMSPESRGFYDLEGLWADAPRIPVG